MPLTSCLSSPTPVRLRADPACASWEVRLSESQALQLRAPHGCWATLRGGRGDRREERAVRVAVVVVGTSPGGGKDVEDKEAVAWASPELVARWGGGLAPGAGVDVEWARNAGTWGKRHGRIVKDAPPVAGAVTVARVKTPQSSGHEDYSSAVVRFFKHEGGSPVIVKEGDVFTVEEADEDHYTASVGAGAGAGADITTLDLTLATRDGTSFLRRGGLPRVFAFQVTHVKLASGASGGSDASPHYAGEVMVNPDTTRVSLVGAVNSLVFGPDSFRVAAATTMDGGIERDVMDVLKPAVEHGTPTCLLLSGSKGSGKRTALRHVARVLGWHMKDADMTQTRGLPQDRAVAHLEEVLADAVDNQPCVVVLNDFACLGGGGGKGAAAATGGNGTEKPEDPDLVSEALRRFCFLPPHNNHNNNHNNVVVVATAESPEDVHAVLHACFTHKLSMPSLDTAEKRAQVVKAVALERGVVLDQDLANRVGGLSAGRTGLELRALVAEAGARAVAGRGRKEYTLGDFEEAMDALPTSTSIDAPKIPAVFWDDVGGLSEAKGEIMDMIETPLKRPDLFQSGMRARSGILLYGPPGTGKTLLAKAVATEFKLNFISVKGPELLDMYIGESERKVRQIFETARAARPCVLFFDELDSLAPQRGRGSDSGGVMDRVVSQLLTEIDGMSSGSGASNSTGVFVIGATNRPDLLDQSLLRPGRFDRLIYLGISKNRTDQMKIVKALTRKFVHGPDVDLDKVLDGLPSSNLTGADFYALCSGAMSNALNRRVGEIQALARARGVTPQAILQDSGDGGGGIVQVEMQDYALARQDLVPSVSEGEIRHYESLRAKFSPAAAAAAASSSTSSSTTS